MTAADEIIIPGVGWFGYAEARSDGWYYRLPLQHDWYGPLASRDDVIAAVNAYIDTLLR